MKSKQEISDEEIQRFMDFDKLLREKEKLVARRKYLRNVKILGSITGVAIVSLTVFLILHNQPSLQADQYMRVDSATVQEKENNSELAVTRSDERKEQIATETRPETQVEKGDQNKALKATRAMPSPDHTEVATSKRANEEIDAPETKIVYQQAEPVNGYPDLYAYFDKELTYPAAAVKDSIQGVVTVMFTVNASGKAEDVKIENSLGQPFDAEVLRVLENMPPWKPAYYNGRLVKSKVSLPLTFQLTKMSPKK